MNGTKKLLAGLLSAACLLGLLSGCGQGVPADPAETPAAESPAEPPMETPEVDGVADYPSAVMAMGTLYYLSGESQIEGRCGVMDGTITSTVSDGLPVENNQSNFGTGYDYQYGMENSIEVYFPEEGKWLVFEANPNAPDGWGIRLEAREVSPTGLTLVCTQSGGHLTGSLQTGCAYWLEQQTAEGWADIEGQGEWGFEDEALPITPEGTTQWTIDWSDLYGELPAGTYRISTIISDFRGTGDWDNKTYYAEFTLGEICSLPPKA